MKWGWFMDGGHHAHGPFDSRQAAADDAAGHYDDPLGIAGITIGQVVDIDPADWIRADIDTLLEIASEDVSEEAADASFEIDDSRREEAKAALARLLADWAREFVTCDVLWYLGGEDEP